MRYRIDYAPLTSLRSRADIVFTKKRVAIYLDGCFWHGCPEHGSSPSAHADYWLPKLERNRTRDLAVKQALEKADWTVLRFWEHESIDSIVATIVQAAEQPA